MGKNPSNHNKDWTDEMNQYIVKNYFIDGIHKVAKDLGRKQKMVKDHIRELARDGYFDGLFNHVSKGDFIGAIMEMQDFHYELLNNIKKRQEETDKMVAQNLELHYHLYKDLLSKFKHGSND